VAAVLAIGIAIFLGEAGAAKFLAAHYQSQAVALSKSPKESDRDRQFEYWEAAVLWQRSDPTLQQAAGQAYLRRLAELEQAESRRDTLAHVGRALFAIDSTGGPSMLNLIAEIAGERFHGALVVAEGETQRRQRMRCRSAKHSLAARALCPLLAEAHWQLADAAGCFSQSDRPEVYLHRAARLRPTDATIWYALGLTCRQSKDHEGAASAWRNCLQINDRFLKQILGNARGEFTLEGIQNELLPPRAETWLTAADMLFPESDQIQRRPFLERALALLEERAEKSTDDLHRLAEIRAELAAPEDKVSCDRAIDSYCAALQRAPMRDDWRLEFARFLHKIGKLAEAKSQLDLVLSQDPGNGFANKLLLVVDEELRLNGTADKK
jgi:tetratricopeptide (TPR) repeat protein